MPAIEWFLSRNQAEQWAIGLFVPVFAAIIIIPIINHLLASRRDKSNRKTSAVLKFRETFSMTIHNLEQGKELASTIVKQFHEKHLFAITEFRPYTRRLTRSRFDKACQLYRDSAEPYLQMGTLAQFQSESSQHMQQKRIALIKALQTLLSFARET